jgi:uncharacterized SAM-binding protein YcdF (DUF218 family)
MEKTAQMISLLTGIIFAIWFTIPFFTHRIANIGNGTGLFISILLIIYGILGSKINRLIGKLAGMLLGKIALIIVAIAALIILSLVVIETTLMIKAATNKPQGNQTVVVLGCRVYGENPSRMLTERLEAAYEYLKENPDAVCILSGGKGDDEAISEAECMYRYLVDKGIDSMRLYKEDKSTSTRENLKFSKEIIKANNLSEEIAIVTNEFHEYRASKVAEALSIKCKAVPARTAWWLFPTYYVRELYGILYEWVF